MKAATNNPLAALAALLSLSTVAGADVLAVSDPFRGFAIRDAELPVIVKTAAEALDVPAVVFRAGETVSVTAPDGNAAVLAENAASAGSAPFRPDAGGLWRLRNSSGGNALVGVSWQAFSDDWSRPFPAGVPFKLHAAGEGPNRKGAFRDFPPVAYSGDGWNGDSSASATLTFVSPSGTSTSSALSGTGTMPIPARDPGVWTVSLAVSGGARLLAEIENDPGAFVMVVR